MTNHYTAVLEVTKVTEPFIEKKNQGSYNAEEISHPREAREIAKVVIRADTLKNLKERVTAHVELVAEY